jgi:hypothetical protein
MFSNLIEGHITRPRDIGCVLAHRGTHSTDGSLHEGNDPCLVLCRQFLQRECRRPHAAVVELCFVTEAKRRISGLELLRSLEKADDATIFGIRGHAVPRLWRESGAVALISSWSRSAIARSDGDISAIFESTSRSLSPPSLLPLALRRTSRTPVTFLVAAHQCTDERVISADGAPGKWNRMLIKSPRAIERSR